MLISTYNHTKSPSPRNIDTVYTPRVGSCLKAKVNKIGPDFIGFLAEVIVARVKES